MIGRLHGTLADKTPPTVLVDVHGVGYEVSVPMSTFYNLPALGEAVVFRVFIAHLVDSGGGDHPDLLGLAQNPHRATIGQPIDAPQVTLLDQQRARSFCTSSASSSSGMHVGVSGHE